LQRSTSAAGARDIRNQIQPNNASGSSRISQDSTSEPNEDEFEVALATMDTLAFCNSSSRPDPASCTGMVVV
jgi:hypothetical protein